MLKLNIPKGTSLAIDLGNTNTVLANEANIATSYPSFIAYSSINQIVKAVGKEAYEMAGRTHQDLKVINPMKCGVIKDFQSASKMLAALVKTSYPQRSFLSRFKYVISGVPYSTTEVERRALRDTLSQFSSSNTYLLFEPLAAAIGLGINIQEPDGKFILDVGGGITEAVIISLSGVVNSSSLKIGGDAFDYEIQQYFRKYYKLEISLQMAEKVKIHVGAASEIVSETLPPFYAIGKDTVLGIPEKIKIDHKEIANVLNPSLTKIEQLIIQTLEECPPELAGDIYKSGIWLTGGGSLLRGLRERLEAKIKIPVHQDPNALLSVTKGILSVLKSPERYKTVLIR